MNAKIPNNKRIINSNFEFETKLNSLKTTLSASSPVTNTSPLFQGRTVEIKTKFTLVERAWDCAYRFAQNTVASESLEEPYLLEKIIDLFSPDPTCPEDRDHLGSLIKNFVSFQDKNIKDITINDLRAIRKELTEKDEIDAIEKLCIIYIKRKCFYPAIECIEALLKNPITPLSQIPELFKQLIELYLLTQSKEGLFTSGELLPNFHTPLGLNQREEILRILIKFYSETCDPEQEINTYKLYLKITATQLYPHHPIVTRLTELSHAFSISQIEFHERILGFPLVFDFKITTLEALMSCYLSENNLKKGTECYLEIRQFRPLQQNSRLLVTLLYKPDITCTNFKFLFEQKFPNEQGPIIMTLDSYYWLWTDIPGKSKLSSAQWNEVFYSEDTAGELEKLALQPCITVSGLNHNQFFNDPTIAEWNFLPQRAAPIDNDDWEVVKVCLMEIYNAIYQDNKTQETNLLNFFDRCTLLSDVQSVRKRIAACVDFLVDFKNSSAQNDFTNKLLKDALGIAIVGGMNCPDAAMSFLVDLEVYIKLLRNPKFLPNIMVQLFKLEALKQLVPGANEIQFKEIDEKIVTEENENSETYRSYLLQFNNALGLGFPRSERMLHDEISKSIPLELTVDKLSQIFTRENLITFAVKNTVFKLRFDAEQQTTLKAKDKELNDATDAYSDAIGGLDEAKKSLEIGKIIAEIKDLRNSFYAQKASELFQTAGFFSIK